MFLQVHGHKKFTQTFMHSERVTPALTRLTKYGYPVVYIYYSGRNKPW